MTTDHDALPGHLSASNRGEDTGAHEGRLPAARCTHDDDEVPVEQPSEEIGGLRLATEEDVVILGLVGKQSFVRAQTSDRFSDRASGIDDRADPLGSAQTAQFLLAELGERYALGEMVDDDLGDGLGNEDLSAGRESTNPGGPVDRGAVVIAVTTFDLSDVDREAHREPTAGRPIPGFECVTSRDRRAHGLSRACKDGERTVALAASLEQATTRSRDRFVDRCIVQLERPRHRPGISVPQRRR